MKKSKRTSGSPGAKLVEFTSRAWHSQFSSAMWPSFPDQLCHTSFTSSGHICIFVRDLRSGFATVPIFTWRLKENIPHVWGYNHPSSLPLWDKSEVCVLGSLKVSIHGTNLQLPNVVLGLIIYSLFATFPSLDYLLPHLLIFLVSPNKMLALESLTQSLLWGTPY